MPAIDRLAKVVTPLGETLLLQSMAGREELSQPFSYELVLLSTDPNVKASSLLGQSMTVELEVEDQATRYFNGIVSRFARGAGVGRYAVYRVTLRPWLWLLSRSADCRIFQNMTVPDVIKQVFRNFGLSDFDDTLSGSYRSWDYIVQYRETAFNFVSRLMEQEGIYYFFTHESGKHKLVLAYGYGAHASAPSYEEVPYFPPNLLAMRDVNVVGAHTEKVGGAQVVMVAGAQETMVLGARSVSVVGSQDTGIIGSYALDVTRDASVAVKGAHSRKIGKDETVDVGKKLVVTVADEIVFKTGDASLTLKKNGDITIKGNNITLTGSGKINAKASGNMTLKGSNIGEN